MMGAAFRGNGRGRGTIGTPCHLLLRHINYPQLSYHDALVINQVDATLISQRDGGFRGKPLL